MIDWPKATKDRPCPACERDHSCLVSPDGTAAVCWHNGNGGKVIQLGKANGHPGKNLNGTETYTGAAHGPKPATGGKVFATVEGAIAAAGRGIAGGVLAAVWTYTDATGAEVMRVARFDLPEGSKEFRPVHRTKAGWKIGDPPGLLPLYRPNEIPAAGLVWVTEGEKAADAAAGLGLAVVTSAHGSSAADKTDWTPLAGRDVAILPDNDAPGGKYARDVATILVRLDPPARVKVVALPDLPDGGDVVEYIDGRDSMDTDAIARSIVALADGVPFIAPADLIGGPVLVCLADVDPVAIDWLWPGRIPLGRITLLVGRPGEGKSFATCDMAARVTTGSPWPDGSECPTGSVILICGEDDPGDTIRPRLDAHYADVKRVHLLSMVRRFSDDGKPHEVMFTLADVAALETAMKAHRDCKLIVIDPIGSFIGGSTDAHRDNEVRGILAPVAQLAAKYGPAVLVVAHRRKSAGFNADESALGSRAFTGIARAVWHLSRDTENKHRRLLLPGKNNLAPEGSGLAFTIAGDPPAIQWEHDPVTMNADEAMAAENAMGTVDESKPGPEPKARSAATAWLMELLADTDEVPAATVKAEATAAGLAWRTVQRACDDLGVIREKNQFSGGWQWRLPKAGTEDATACQHPTDTENLASWHLHENQGENSNSACQVPEDATLDNLGTLTTNDEYPGLGDLP